MVTVGAGGGVTFAGGLTTSDMDGLDAVTPCESVTVATMPLVVPLKLGVPVMDPVEALRLRPAGKVVTAHVYGGVPLLAVSTVL